MASRRFLGFLFGNGLQGVRERCIRAVRGNIRFLQRSGKWQQNVGSRGLSRVKQFVTLAFIPTVSAFGFTKKKEDKPIKFLSEDEEFIQKCDALYDDNQIEELYNLLLPRSGTGNEEILWRLARAACEYGKQLGGEKRKEHIYEAYRYIRLAMDINDKNFAVHKWYAILLDLIGEYEGTKQRITNAYKVKDHLERAVELNPKDATTIHSLGVWCFMVADLPWYQQKIASLIFATPPKSTYQEALNYFLEAEKVDPGFYSMNLLMLGKTHLRLKQKDLAIPYLLRVKNFPVRTEDDKRAHKEALELLTSIGIN